MILNRKEAKVFSVECNFCMRYTKILIYITLMSLCACNAPPPVKQFTDFEGAAVQDFRVDRSGNIHFSMPENPGGDERLWFYFKLTASELISPTFVIENAEYAHQHNWDVVRPVVSVDGLNWIRVEDAGLSDGATLASRIAAKLTGREPVFQFKSPVESKELWVAYSYPYFTTELDQYLSGIQVDRRVTVSVLGKSEEGRDIQFISIENPESSTESARTNIWVICREHPGETPASFVLEGFINDLLAQPLESSLLSRFRFNIVPLFNTDGASNGYYYRNSGGIDIAQDWGSFESVEVQQLYRAMLDDLNSNTVDLVLNLHSANEPRSHFFLETPSDRLPPDLATLQDVLIRSASGVHPQLQTEQTVALWDYSVIAGNYLSKNFNVYSLYLESNYSRGADLSLVTPDSLRDLGAALTTIVERALANPGEPDDTSR